MKKITIWGYWFYTLAAFIFIAIAISNTCLTIMLIKAQPNAKILRYYLAFSILGGLVLIIVSVCILGQFTILSSKGIKTRAICRTIRYLKWEDVKEVRFERLDVSVKGFFTSGWYVIDDGIERKQQNGLVGKKTHITVRATKRARKALETFWHGPIIEEQLKETDT